TVTTPAHTPDRHHTVRASTVVTHPPRSWDARRCRRGVVGRYAAGGGRSRETAGGGHLCPEGQRVDGARVAAGGRPAHADEQPRSPGGGAARRSRRLRRHGEG